MEDKKSNSKILSPMSAGLLMLSSLTRTFMVRGLVLDCWRLAQRFQRVRSIQSSVRWMNIDRKLTTQRFIFPAFPLDRLGPLLDLLRTNSCALAEPYYTQMCRKNSLAEKSAPSCRPARAWLTQLVYLPSIIMTNFYPASFLWMKSTCCHTIILPIIFDSIGLFRIEWYLGLISESGIGPSFVIYCQ